VTASPTAATRPSPVGRERRTHLLDRIGAGWLRLDPLGLTVGTTFAALSMTPSLLPRSWLFQGVVSGVSAALGYGAGSGLGWLVRRWPPWRRTRERLRQRAPAWAPPAAWLLLLLAVMTTLATMLSVSAEWQGQSAALLGLGRTTTTGWLRAGPLMVLVAGALLAAARGVRWLSRWIAGLLRRWVRLPQRIASVVGAAVVTVLAITLVNDVLLSHALSAADSAFRATNLENPADVRQPVSSLRSGSPSSLVSWDSLGLQGRKFVAGGPDGAELATVAPGAVRAPIRVYAGLDSAGDSQARAELAVAELRRTGAFDREVIVVMTTTGRGWVNTVAAASIELIYGGDTAIVATQYSYLPSWLSFLLDPGRSEEAGRLLFDAVHAAVEDLPVDDRPELLVYGESLGSQGSEAAFDSLAELRAKTDGVLWVGPPNANTLWRSLVERRDPGTSEVAPEYASGLVVRFADSVADLDRPDAPWIEPRVLYLQNASDPIVWWSPALLFDRPDWLDEARAADVNPAMSWYPVITFWQVSADLTHAKEVPDGHGHNYGDLILDGWVAVAAPDGWTAVDTERVRSVLDA
jgi:uncharacterized membrane protein